MTTKPYPAHGNYFASNSLIWLGKWVACTRRLAPQSLSPGKMIVLSFSTKIAVPCQCKKYADTFRLCQGLCKCCRGRFTVFSMFCTVEFAHENVPVFYCTHVMVVLKSNQSHGFIIKRLLSKCIYTFGLLPEDFRSLQLVIGFLRNAQSRVQL